MGRKLSMPVMVGSTVYEAGTDEDDILGADSIRAEGVWDEGSSVVTVTVADAEEIQKAAEALKQANATIDELRQRIAELEKAAGQGDAEGGGGSPYDDLDVDALKAEIDKRNEGRDDESRISKRGGKDALTAALVADDATSA